MTLIGGMQMDYCQYILSRCDDGNVTSALNGQFSSKAELEAMIESAIKETRLPLNHITYLSSVMNRFICRYDTFLCDKNEDADIVQMRCIKQSREYCDSSQNESLEPKQFFNFLADYLWVRGSKYIAQQSGKPMELVDQYSVLRKSIRLYLAELKEKYQKAYAEYQAINTVQGMSWGERWKADRHPDMLIRKYANTDEYPSECLEENKKACWEYVVHYYAAYIVLSVTFVLYDKVMWR